MRRIPSVYTEYYLVDRIYLLLLRYDCVRPLQLDDLAEWIGFLHNYFIINYKATKICYLTCFYALILLRIKEIRIMRKHIFPSSNLPINYEPREQKASASFKETLAIK